jgi:hypothetical protein
VSGDVLTTRDLNRATLARQMLLERAVVPATGGVERLVGLQAQAAMAPYVGLWTRLAGFERDDLAAAIDDRTVVKATLMRGTLHLATAADLAWLRPSIQPALTAGWESIAGRRSNQGEAFDLDQVLAAGREFVAEEPRTFAEISAMLTELYPEADVGSMRYGIRTHVPLVQVPADTRWSYPGRPRFTLAEAWLGTPVPDEPDPGRLVARYLAAFGPATVADMLAWSGQDMSDAVEAARSDLVSFRDEKGRELLDLPDAPRPGGDAGAPERFLPEYDNLLLSHKVRTRVLADEHRSGVYLPGLRVRATFLVDGLVAGGWKVDKAKGVATLTLEPFSSLSARARSALEAEGEGLVRFVEPSAKSYAVAIAD